jgi:hypothetical protein
MTTRQRNIIVSLVTFFLIIIGGSWVMEQDYDCNHSQKRFIQSYELCMSLDKCTTTVDDIDLYNRLLPGCTNELP